MAAFSARKPSATRVVGQSPTRARPRSRLIVAAVLGLGFPLLTPAIAAACVGGWQEQDLQSQLMCPTCHVPLDQSQSTEANRIRAFITGRCKAGWSEQKVKQSLVAQFGDAILAAPPVSGFDALAWIVPGVVLLAGAALCSALAVTWSGRRTPKASPASDTTDEAAGLDPALERRIDAELDSD